MTTFTFSLPLPTRQSRKPPAPPPPKPANRPSDRLARQLALAHHLERLIERGVLRDYADAARVLGLTRARVSQIMDLLGMAVERQEELLTETMKPLVAQSSEPRPVGEPTTVHSTLPT